MRLRPDPTDPAEMSPERCLDGFASIAVPSAPRLSLKKPPTSRHSTPLPPHNSGAKPRLMVFSQLARGSTNWRR